MRLIDADALGVGRCSRDLLPADYCAGWNGLVGLIEQAPTIDAVPVIRCKDCEHYAPHALACHHEHMNGVMPIDGYCSNGKRRVAHESL